MNSYHARIELGKKVSVQNSTLGSDFMGAVSGQNHKGHYVPALAAFQHSGMVSA